MNPDKQTRFVATGIDIANTEEDVLNSLLPGRKIIRRALFKDHILGGVCTFESVVSRSHLICINHMLRLEMATVPCSIICNGRTYNRLSSPSKLNRRSTTARQCVECRVHHPHVWESAHTVAKLTHSNPDLTMRTHLVQTTPLLAAIRRRYYHDPSTSYNQMYRPSSFRLKLHTSWRVTFLSYVHQGPRIQCIEPCQLDV